MDQKKREKKEGKKRSGNEAGKGGPSDPAGK